MTDELRAAIEAVKPDPRIWNRGRQYTEAMRFLAPVIAPCEQEDVRRALREKLRA